MEITTGSTDNGVRSTQSDDRGNNVTLAKTLKCDSPVNKNIDSPYEVPDVQM